MRKIDKEKIESQLESIQRIEPGEDFLLKMENIAIRALNPISKVSRLQIILVAASLALLVFANFFLLSQSTDTSAISDAYNLIPTKAIYNG